MRNEEIMIFKNEEFGQVRTMEINGNVYFAGTDVAKCLGYKNTNDAITRHCKKDGVDYHEGIDNLGRTQQIKFINESNLYRLIVKSNLPSAEKFESWVFDEVLPSIRKYGSFDPIKSDIEKIEDEKERQLKLSIYTLEQTLKVNPTDALTQIAYNNFKQELNTYMQNKKLNHLENKIKILDNKAEEQKNKLNNMFVIGNRIQFSHAINRVARATGKKQSEVYALAYSKLRDLYGIDLSMRSKAKRKKIQEERLNSNKKPYSKSTLNSKANNLVIADEIDCWKELGHSLNAVQNDLVS